MLVFSLDLFFKGTADTYRIFPEAKFINDAETVLRHKKVLDILLLYCSCYCSVLTSLPFFTIPTYGKANRRIILTLVSYTHSQHILEHFALP